MEWQDVLLEWRDLSTCETPQASGVYALVADRTLPKLLKPDTCGILYIGKTDNLCARLLARPSSSFQHHVLSNVIDPNCLTPGAHQWRFPLSLDNSSDPRIWNQDWRLKVLYHHIPELGNADLELAAHWEDALLVYHFFHFGQYPPLNVSARSVRGIHNWREYYQHWHSFNEAYFDASLKQIEALTVGWRS